MIIRTRWFYTFVLIAVLGLTSSAARATLIGVDFNLAGPAPSNWSRLTATNNIPGTTPTPMSLTNLIAENGAITNVDFTVNSNVGTVRGYDITLAATIIPTHSNSLANIGGYFHNDLQDNDTLTAVFSELDATSFYKVWVFITRTTTVDTNTTITGGGSPITFRSAGAFSNLFINGQLGSNSRTLDSYALQVLPSNSSAITISWTEGPASNRYSVAGVAIEQVPEPATASLAILASLAMLNRHRRRVPMLRCSS